MDPDIGLQFIFRVGKISRKVRSNFFYKPYISANTVPCPSTSSIFFQCFSCFPPLVDEGGRIKRFAKGQVWSRRPRGKSPQMKGVLR